jgi:hypothetical protein
MTMAATADEAGHEESPTLEDIDQWWAEEAESRVKDIEAGTVTPVDGEEVFREIWRRLRRVNLTAE